MQFEFTRRRSARSPVTDAATFRVARLNQAPNAGKPGLDCSHVIDRSYNYHSPRELRWHLAERFGLAPAAVSVREARA
ncbi:AsnC family transcriptional regulator [Methylobacterium durans]|uniref:AsnC family transcriptional regulator n=1 Tax=Methylobacterium durans TaxID=2202825 RepID=UPI002B002AA7|nr:AsnC family transcriptional regulator [Methylobacterium durans]MEA1832312.1 AsnC family transcriptional regulator [Methylobacterium durans]